MVSWLQTRQSGITFDVGAAGIRAYQFRAERWRDHNVRLCDGLQVDRTPAGDDEQLSAPTVDPGQLSRLIGQARFSGREVTLVLSSPEVQFAPMRLPEQVLSQPPARIEQALRWEVAQESRSNPDELEVRHWTLPQARGQQANVMAVTMPAKTALGWCDDLAAQGLELRRIDVSPCALVRLARQMWTPDEHDLWGVLDLGLRHTTLTVVAGATPVYIRSITGSAHEWTRQVAAAFEVAYPVAEQLKRTHGIQPDLRGSTGGTTGRELLHSEDLTTALSGILREPLHRLAREIGRCFSYTMQGYPDHAAKRLFLAGGGAELTGLTGLLERELDLSVAALAATAATAPAWNEPLPDIRFDSRAAVAVGAALLDLEAA